MPKINLNDISARARQSAKDRYHEYLDSPEWLHRRDAVLARDYYCRNCTVNLSREVHHLTYARIYRERLSDLVGLCRACHRLAHE